MISVIGAASYERAEAPRMILPGLTDYSDAGSRCGKGLKEQLEKQLCAGRQHDKSRGATEEFS